MRAASGPKAQAAGRAAQVLRRGGSRTAPVLDFQADPGQWRPDAGDLLAMLRSPLNIAIEASGETQKPSLNLSVACADIEVSGHAIKKPETESWRQ